MIANSPRRSNCSLMKQVLVAMTLILVGCATNNQSVSTRTSVPRTISEGYRSVEVPTGAYSGRTRVIETPAGAPPNDEIRRNYQPIGQSMFLLQGNYNEYALTKAGEAVGADIVICWRASMAGAAIFLRHR